VRQTTNAKETKEPVVVGADEFAAPDSEVAQSGDKETLSRVVQAKMAVSSPSDPFEVEAEKVASDFVKRSYSPGGGSDPTIKDPTINRSISAQIARRASGDGLENSGAGLETSAETAQKISRATASGGRPLDGATRGRFEDGLGADLSAVKVHTDSSSDTLCRSLSADAFSTGRDVFFSSGTFNPGTKSGDHLLAHELTHVVQQGAAPTIARSKAPTSAGQADEGSVFRLTVGRANDPSEDLADEMADKAVASLHRSASQPATIHRSAADADDPLGGTKVDDNIERSINSQRGKGSSLGAREAEHFSNEYGTDLSGVRVHTDSTADSLSRSLQANAFTTGSDIFFRQGTYKPGTSDGDHLIGHELAHVATEGGGAQRSIRRLGFGGLFGGGTPDPNAPGLLDEQRKMSKTKLMVDVGTFDKFVNTDRGGKPPQYQPLKDSVAAYTALHKGKTALMKPEWGKGMTILNKTEADLAAYEAGPKAKDEPHRQKALSDWRIAIEELKQRFEDPDAAAKAGAERLKVEAETAKVQAEIDEAESKSVFERLKDLIYSGVQDKVDTIEAELKLNIPVQAGLKIPVIMSASVELGEDDEGVGMRVSFEAGAKGDVGGVKITALLGGYLESKGKDIAMAADLLGYAFYRRLAESNVPAEVEAYMFGGKEGTRESAATRMAEIEKAAFGEKDSEWYAESGASASVEAAIKIPKALGLKIKGGGTTGTRTDRASLDMAGIAAGDKKAKDGGSAYNPLDWGVKGLKSVGAIGADRGREKSIGRSTNGLSLSAELTKPFEAEVTYEGKWVEEEVEGENGLPSTRINKLDSRELGAELKVPEDFLKSFGMNPNKKGNAKGFNVKEMIEPFINQVLAFLQACEDTSKEKTPRENQDMWAGAVVDELMDQAKGAIEEKLSGVAASAMASAASTSVGKAVTGAANSAKDAVTGALGIKTESEESMAVGVKWDFLNKELTVETIEATERTLKMPGLEASLTTKKQGGSFKKKSG
jgi:hypothetical protein